MEVKLNEFIVVMSKNLRKAGMISRMIGVLSGCFSRVLLKCHRYFGWEVISNLVDLVIICKGEEEDLEPFYLEWGGLVCSSSSIFLR